MSAQDSVYYQYKPLPARYIRLLRVHLGSGPSRFDGDIKVDLVEKRLDEADFDALSYTWGPPTLEEQEAADLQIFTKVERCYPIFFDGKIIRVTQSLRDVLRKLRMLEDPERAEQLERSIRRKKLPHTWADGVCINQDDMKERAQQVGLMADIYTRASLLLAWVGESDDYTRGAIQTALILGKLADITPNDQHSATNMRNPAFFAKVGAELIRPEQWWEWAILLSRPWFQRTWVLQEAMLSSIDRAVIICGTMTVQMGAILLGLRLVYGSKWELQISADMDDVVHTKTRFQRHEIEVLSWLLKIHPHHWISRAWALRKAPSFYTTSRWVLPYTMCSNPRDKIYGTLGFASDWRNLDEKQLPIDYTLSTTEIYCRATKYLLKKSRNLDLLTIVAVRPAAKPGYQLPSWCPDYNEMDSRPQTLMNNPGEVESLWSVSGKSKFTPNATVAEFSTLNVRGRTCDVIQSEMSCHDIYMVWSAFSDLLKWLLDIMTTSNPSVCTSILQAMERALTTYDEDPLGSNDIEGMLRLTATIKLVTMLWDAESPLPMIKSSVEDLHTLVGRIVRIEPEAARFLPDTTVLLREVVRRRQYEKSGKTISPKHKSLLEADIPGMNGNELRGVYWLPRIVSIMNNRKLFFTRDQRIGIGHSTLKKGDQIWLLAGSKVPFILRTNDDGRTELIGEAYVDGLMFGEQWLSDENDGMDEIILS